MSDLADTIDDLICSFESDGKTMDTLIMYLFCWALVGFAALAVGKFAYGRVVGRAAAKTGAAAAGGAASAAAGKGATDAAADGADRNRPQQHHHHPRVVPPTPPVTRKRLGSKTGRTSAAVAGIAAGLSAVPAAAAAGKAFSPEQQQAHQHRPPPAASGNDPDAVRWTNDVFRWLCEAVGGAGEPPVFEYLLGEWTSSLNEYTKKSFAEVSRTPFSFLPVCLIALVGIFKNFFFLILIQFYVRFILCTPAFSDVFFCHTPPLGDFQQCHGPLLQIV